MAARYFIAYTETLKSIPCSKLYPRVLNMRFNTIQWEPSPDQASWILFTKYYLTVLSKQPPEINAAIIHMGGWRNQVCMHVCVCVCACLCVMIHYSQNDTAWNFNAVGKKSKFLSIFQFLASYSLKLSKSAFPGRSFQYFQHLSSSLHAVESE